MRVLHYVEHWLELSSGFVHAHVAHSRHRAVVVSHNATENRDAFPHRPVVRLDRLAAAVPPHRWPAFRTSSLRAIASAFRVDVVHVHFGYAVRDVLPFVERTRLPLVLSLHGSDATSLPSRQPGHYDPVVDHVDAVVVRAPETHPRRMASSKRNTYLPTYMPKISGTVVATIPQRKRPKPQPWQPRQPGTPNHRPTTKLRPTWLSR